MSGHSGYTGTKVRFVPHSEHPASHEPYSSKQTGINIMNIESMANYAEVIGGIAVIVSLIYVGVQIRSNTSTVRSAATQSVHEAFATWYRMLAADANLTQLVTDGLRDYSSLSETDKGRFVATFMAFLSCSQDAFIKWREDSLSAELWMGWELIMMNLVSAPGGKDFWSERGYCFGDEFQNHVENIIMKRRPHKNAKPLGAFSIGGSS
jgi:hypothetical protein